MEWLLLTGYQQSADVDNLIEITEVMGGSVKRDGETLEIDPRGVKGYANAIW